MLTAFIILAVLALVVVFVAKSVVIIQQSETMVIERLGQYHKTLHAGLNIVLPILDKPKEIEWRYVQEEPDGRVIIRRERLSKIDLRERFYDFPSQSVITKENVVIQINGLLSYQVTDPVKMVYEIYNMPDAIEKLTQTSLRSIIGEMTLDETLGSRDHINSRLLSILDVETDKWGVKVLRVEIQKIEVPAHIQDAMEKVMRAERSKRATILEAEGYKQSKINRAEADRLAQIYQADGEARSRLRVARAESEAIEKISNSLTASNSDPAQYLVALRYIEALKEMVSGKNNKVVYLPYEATGLLGSVGGISELFAKVKPFEPDIIRQGPAKTGE